MTVIEDLIYGRFNVEGVIEELLFSQPVQRLRAVHQGGAIFLFDSRLSHTRFDHSLGVFWLVREYGGSISEQIAALLHDVSHTAFSHVGDHVFHYPAEDYHEHIFEKIIQDSDIPAILKKYGFEDALNNFGSYTLLERSSPELCADRIDYILRDSFHAGLTTVKAIENFLTNLTTDGTRFLCTSNHADQWIRNLSALLSDKYFNKPEFLFVNQSVAGLLRTAISENKLQERDLLLTDFEVLEKINNHYEYALTDIVNLVGFSNFKTEAAISRIKERNLKKR